MPTTSQLGTSQSSPSNVVLGQPNTGFTSSASDAINGTDAVTRGQVFQRSILEQYVAPLHDTAVAFVTVARSRSETVHGTDSTAANRIFARARSEAVAGTDVAGHGSHVFLASSDATGGTDGFGGGKSLHASMTDATAGSDSMTRQLTLLRSRTDALGGVESTASTFQGHKTFNVAITDSLPAADATQTAKQFARTLSDALAGTDAATTLRTSGRSITESLGGSDAASRAANIIRTGTESVSGVDGLTYFLSVIALAPGFSSSFGLPISFTLAFGADVMSGLASAFPTSVATNVATAPGTGGTGTTAPGADGIVRWLFSDGFFTYLLEVNPNAGGSPAYKRQITTKVTTAPDGSPLSFDGGPDVPKGQFSGVIYSAQQYNDLVKLFGRNNAVVMIDDLGRAQTIWIERFQFKPAPRRLFPNRQTYTCDYSLLSPAVV